jgi:PmbA protein
MTPEETLDFMVREGQRLGASDVATNWIRYSSRMVRFSNDEVTVANYEESDVLSALISFNGRMAIGSIENLDPKTIRDFMPKLVKIARVMKVNQDYAPLPMGPFKYPSRRPPVDRKIGELAEKTLDYVQSAIDAAIEEGAKRTAGALITRGTKMWLKTSSGVESSQSGSSIELSVRAFLSEDASGNGISCSRTARSFDAEKAGRRAGQVAKMAKNPVGIEAGEYRVLLGPYIFANLLNDVVNSASAFSVDAGLSFFPEKLMGKKVASDQLTIYDDGVIPAGLSSRIFDDEGVPVQRTPVLRKGFLTNLLHNTMTAKKHKTKTTGNAGWIAPGPWNIVVEPGSVKQDNLLKELGEGLYITNTWYTRFQDYRKGDFSTVCRDGAFRVHDGEIVSSVKNLRISDNMINMMKNVDSLSKEREWVKWWEVQTPTYAPHALVKKLGITKTTK